MAAIEMFGAPQGAGLLLLFGSLRPSFGRKEGQRKKEVEMRNIHLGSFASPRLESGLWTLVRTLSGGRGGAADHYARE